MSKNDAYMSSNPLEDLPDYLGLGVLDVSSVERSRDKVIAFYKFENEVVYRVSISNKDFQIVELLDGQPIATTAEQVSFRETFFHHLISQPPSQSKRFERLYHRLADHRNIVVRFALEPRYLYYPAGYLFSLRQPIGYGNKSIVDRFAAPSVGHSDQAGFKFDSVREGIILRLLQNGEVSVEQTQMADFSTTLHRLVDSVDAVWQAGMVPKEKEYQLMVLDSSLNAAGNISIYLGEISRGSATFSAIVTEGVDLDLEQGQKNFRDSSLQLLENFKKQTK